MGEFSEGVRAGTAMGSPLDGLLEVLKEDFARKRKERKEEDDATKMLRGEVMKLGRETAATSQLQKEKSALNIQEEEAKSGREMSQQEKLLESLGVSRKRGGGLPEGVSVKAGDVTYTGKQTAAEKGSEKALEEAFTRAQGVKRAVKRLNSITKQFNKALPQEQTGGTTTGQRISGFISVLGAETGVKSNPDLLALKSTAKLQLRGILRDMGEGARMSDQDIEQNLSVIEQSGLSNEERTAKVRTFVQVAVDSMDDAILQEMNKDQSTMSMMKELGVDFPSFGAGGGRTITLPSGATITLGQ